MSVLSTLRVRNGNCLTCSLFMAIAFFTSRPAPAQQPPRMPPLVISDVHRDAYQRIMRQLDRRISCEFQDAPLSEVIDYFSDRFNIPLLVQQSERALGGDALDRPVTCELRHITGRAALDLILHEFDLTWTLDHGTLLVTTHDVAQERLLLGVYDVSDLIIPDGDYDSLCDLITMNCAPASWPTGTGPGPIDCFVADGIAVLIIHQTYQVHEEIMALLSALRYSYNEDLSESQTTTLPCPMFAGDSGD